MGQGSHRHRRPAQEYPGPRSGRHRRRSATGLATPVTSHNVVVDQGIGLLQLPLLMSVFGHKARLALFDSLLALHPMVWALGETGVGRLKPRLDHFKWAK